MMFLQGKKTRFAGDAAAVRSEERVVLEERTGGVPEAGRGRR
jgi:hypothetical protein